MLRPLGVSRFDETVYRALLRRPNATPAELASSVDATVVAVHESLARLGGLGLVHSAGGKRYTPNDPEPALEALVHRREAELHAARTAATALTAEFRIGSLRSQPERLVEVVSGVDEIFRRSMELYQSATQEVLAFERPPYTAPATFDELASELPVLERGVRMRVLYSAAALAIPGKFDTVSTLAGHGEGARTLPDLPIKLMIVDRRAARVSLTTDDYATESVAFVRDSGLLNALIALFDAYWERAHPLGGPASEELTAAEARVLSLLGAGFKDEAIARQLHTSMRTTGRRILHILELLKASTRFQAGAQAVRRGWL